MKDITIQKIGNTNEVDILNWKVKIGDNIKIGDSLVEVESEKITFVVEADITGVITEILVGEGKTIPVGTIICRIDDKPNKLSME